MNERRARKRDRQKLYRISELPENCGLLSISHNRWQAAQGKIQLDGTCIVLSSVTRVAPRSPLPVVVARSLYTHTRCREIRESVRALPKVLPGGTFVSARKRATAFGRDVSRCSVTRNLVALCPPLLPRLSIVCNCNIAEYKICGFMYKARSRDIFDSRLRLHPVAAVIVL